MRAAIGDLMPTVGVKAACEAFDFPRASFYRKGFGVLSPAAGAVRLVPRALVAAEREAVLSCLHEERFQNSAPAAIYATLLDEGRYHCSIRTMYRILESEGETKLTDSHDWLFDPLNSKVPNLWAQGGVHSQQEAQMNRTKALSAVVIAIFITGNRGRMRCTARLCVWAPTSILC